MGRAATPGITVLSADGKTLHDLGSVASVENASALYSKFNSTTATYFSYNSTGFPEPVVKQTPVVFRGMPQPASHFRTDGRGYVRLPNGDMVMSIIVYWGGKHASPDPAMAPIAQSVVAFKATDGVGLTWEYVGTILDAASWPTSEEGPNENDLALLRDGSILCVIRVDGGDGRKTHHMQPYVRTISRDGGKSWSNAVAMKDTAGNLVGCARPRLLALPGAAGGGAVVLSGGRLNAKNHDIYVWINAAGDGVDWEAHSISYLHNTLQTNGTLKFSRDLNNTGARESTSYTSLVGTSDASGYIVYSRLLPSPSVAFSLHFKM